MKEPAMSKQRPIRLTTFEATIISDLLRDLTAEQPQLPILDGEVIGCRLLQGDERRAVAELNHQLARELGINPP